MLRKYYQIRTLTHHMQRATSYISNENHPEHRKHQQPFKESQEKFRDNTKEAKGKLSDFVEMAKDATQNIKANARNATEAIKQRASETYEHTDKSKQNLGQNRSLNLGNEDRYDSKRDREQLYQGIKDNKDADTLNLKYETIDHACQETQSRSSNDRNTNDDIYHVQGDTLENTRQQTRGEQARQTEVGQNLEGKGKLSRASDDPNKRDSTNRSTLGGSPLDSMPNEPIGLGGLGAQGAPGGMHDKKEEDRMKNIEEIKKEDQINEAELAGKRIY